MPLTTPATSDLLAALQAPEELPEQPLPSSDLARRYAESGTLTPRADSTAAATASGLAAADDQLLTDLSLSYRPSAGTAQATMPSPAPAQPLAMTLTINGLAVPLSPAQAVAVRAAVGASLRRLGPGAGTSDSEDPTSHVAEPNQDERGAQIVHEPAPARASLTTAGHPRSPLPEHDDAHRAGLDEAEHPLTVAPTRANPGHPVPYEPAIIAAPVPDPLLLGPGPEAAVLTAPTPVINGLAIAFGPAISPRDIAVRSASGHVSIAAGGRDVLLLAVTTPLVAQLVFADGSTSLVALGD